LLSSEGIWNFDKIMEDSVKAEINRCVCFASGHTALMAEMCNNHYKHAI
jgi:hypothetical protein